MSNVDAYLSGITPIQKQHYDHLSKIVRGIIPDADEVMSYGIPTFKYRGKTIIHFGAFKDHMSLFPGAMSEETQAKLKDFKISKGTIQFTHEKPVPETIIKQLIKDRVTDIGA